MTRWGSPVLLYYVLKVSCKTCAVAGWNGTRWSLTNSRTTGNSGFVISHGWKSFLLIAVFNLVLLEKLAVVSSTTLVTLRNLVTVQSLIFAQWTNRVRFTVPLWCPRQGSSPWRALLYLDWNYLLQLSLSDDKTRVKNDYWANVFLDRQYIGAEVGCKQTHWLFFSLSMETYTVKIEPSRWFIEGSQNW